jgi:hypothetical protein
MTIGSFHYIGRLAVFAKNRVPTLALEAFAARNGPIQHYRISGAYMANRRAHGVDYSGAFMSHHQGPFPTQRSLIGMADAGRLDLDQHFITDWFTNLDALKREVAFAIRDGCLGLHRETVNGAGSTHNAGI